MHKSTGNDIVDLGSTDKIRTSEPRFYSKIISGQEKELYHTSPGLNLSFNTFVWLAWSVKESVYKFLKRDTPLLVFSPAKIGLQNISIVDDVYCGTIMFRAERLYYQTEVTDQWIHSTVNTHESFAQVKSGVKEIKPANNAERSALARQFLSDQVKKILGEHIAIEKSSFGYPVVIQSRHELDIPISLSHDGNYAAYSINLSYL